MRRPATPSHDPVCCECWQVPKLDILPPPKENRSSYSFGNANVNVDVVIIVMCRGCECGYVIVVYLCILLVCGFGRRERRSEALSSCAYIIINSNSYTWQHMKNHLHPGDDVSPAPPLATLRLCPLRARLPTLVPPWTWRSPSSILCLHSHAP
jgi:hypothetical protein